MAKKSKLIRELDRRENSLLRRARQEIARQHPEDRGEIISGEWDSGMGVQGLLARMRGL